MEKREQKRPLNCEKKPPHTEKNVAKLPPHGKKVDKHCCSYMLMIN